MTEAKIETVKVFFDFPVTEIDGTLDFEKYGIPRSSYVAGNRKIEKYEIEPGISTLIKGIPVSSYIVNTSNIFPVLYDGSCFIPPLGMLSCTCPAERLNHHGFRCRSLDGGSCDECTPPTSYYFSFRLDEKTPNPITIIVDSDPVRLTRERSRYLNKCYFRLPDVARAEGTATLRAALRFLLEIPLGGVKEGECVYCGKPANSRDHFFPVSVLHRLRSYREMEQPEDLTKMLVTLPSCIDCNMAANALYFPTFKSKTAYIKDRLRREEKNSFEYFNL